MRNRVYFGQHCYFHGQQLVRNYGLEERHVRRYWRFFTPAKDYVSLEFPLS